MPHESIMTNTKRRTTSSHSCNRREGALVSPAPLRPNEFLEEVRNLRASLTIYRHLVDRLLLKEAK